MDIKSYVLDKYTDLPIYEYEEERGVYEYWSFIGQDAIRFDHISMKWVNSCLNKQWVLDACTEVVCA